MKNEHTDNVQCYNPITKFWQTGSRNPMGLKNRIAPRYGVPITMSNFM